MFWGQHPSFNIPIQKKLSPSNSDHASEIKEFRNRLYVSVSLAGGLGLPHSTARSVWAAFSS
jgi:hypothetical protein